MRSVGRIPILVTAVILAAAGVFVSFDGVLRASASGSVLLQGQVTDHFGAAIPNIIVTATNADTGSVAGEVASDREGIFILSGLEPGNYTIKTGALFPFGETEEPVVIEASGATGLKLMLGRGCSRRSDSGGLQERFLAETVRLALKDSLERLGVPHAKGQAVYMSKANIKPDWVASLEDLDVRLIPEGTRPPADKEGRTAKFIRISEIRTAGGCSSVSIGYVTGGDRAQTTDDAGFTLEFRKLGDKWLKRTVLEVIS